MILAAIYLISGIVISGITAALLEDSNHTRALINVAIWPLLVLYAFWASVVVLTDHFLERVR